MSEDWKVQISIKTQLGSMINLRGNSKDELLGELNVLNELVPQIHATEQQLFAAGTVANGLPLAPQQPPQPAPTPFPTPAPAGTHTPASGFPVPPSGGGGQVVPFPAAAPQQAGIPVAASPGAGQPPLCQHNLPAKWVPGGVSKRTGSPYNGFWSCPLDRASQCSMPR